MSDYMTYKLVKLGIVFFLAIIYGFIRASWKQRQSLQNLGSGD